ncbi:hypothetical protein C8R47DRAFT_416061 [Mycena vitilis]|nr:hypothetical protein C8R47DRAFT_416061 [Mycena vitilis]
MTVLLSSDSDFHSVTLYSQSVYDPLGRTSLPSNNHPMEICGPPDSWSLLAHTSWPLEYALRVFELSLPPTVRAPKHTSVWPSRIQIKSTPTNFYVLAPTFRVAATACSLAIIGSLVVLVVCVAIWTQSLEPKPQTAALSESTVLRIHDLASRQPFNMPPDDDGDPGTFSALPFAENPRKQNLLIFWLALLLAVGVMAWFLRPVWQVPVSSYVAEKHATLSWGLTLFLSAVMANISGGFLQFAFSLVPITKSTIHWAKWFVIMVSVEPPAAVRSAYWRITRAAQYLLHWYFGIPHDHALPDPLERSATVVSTAVSVLGGYHLISSRIARNYTVLFKSLSQWPLNLFGLYVSLRQAPILAPTNLFQSWGWWAARHLLIFSVGELSLWTISWSKLTVLLTPTLIICAYNIYKYNQVIIPPRSALQLAFDSLERKLYRQEISAHRQNIELVEIKRLVQNIDMRFAAALPVAQAH